LKTTNQKHLEKIDKLLSNLKIGQASTSATNCTIQLKNNTSDSENTECSHDSTDSDIKILEKKIGKIDLNQNSKEFLTSLNLLTLQGIGIQNPLLMIYSLKKDFSNPNYLSLLIKYMNGTLMICLNKN
jgi:hypothetical protein